MKINFSNGSSRWFDENETTEALKYAEENGITLEAVVYAMDNELREAVAAEFAPCSDAEFLEMYLRRASEDIVIG